MPQPESCSTNNVTGQTLTCNQTTYTKVSGNLSLWLKKWVTEPVPVAHA